MLCQIHGRSDFEPVQITQCFRLRSGRPAALKSVQDTECESLINNSEVDFFRIRLSIDQRLKTVTSDKSTNVVLRKIN